MRFYCLTCFVISSVVAADSYGYGLVGITNPEFTIGKKIFKRDAFFRDLKERAELARSELMNQEGEGLSIDSAKTNISCFAFEFFDENGESLSDDHPAYYGHDLTKSYVSDMQIQPFYFLSGRHKKEFSRADMLFLEPFLGEGSETRSIYLDMQEMRKKLKDLKNSLLKMPWYAEFDNDVSSHLWSGQEVLIKSIVLKLREKVPESERMWFKCVTDRSRISRTHEDNYNRVLLARGDDADFCILSEPNDFIPGVKATTESVFVHSEQVALAHMHYCVDKSTKIPNFRKFLDYLCENKFIKDSVKYIIMYEYTYNTSCKRCARSIYYDFNNTLKSIIQNVFPGVKMRYILGATKEYEKTAHRKQEPESPGTGPNDYIYNGDYPIPLDDELETNEYLYQFIIPFFSFKKKIKLIKTKKFGVLDYA